MTPPCGLPNAPWPRTGSKPSRPAGSGLFPAGPTRCHSHLTPELAQDQGSWSRRGRSNFGQVHIPLRQWTLLAANEQLRFADRLMGACGPGAVAIARPDGYRSKIGSSRVRAVLCCHNAVPNGRDAQQAVSHSSGFGRVTRRTVLSAVALLPSFRDKARQLPPFQVRLANAFRALPIYSAAPLLAPHVSEASYRIRLR